MSGGNIEGFKVDLTDTVSQNNEPVVSQSEGEVKTQTPDIIKPNQGAVQSQEATNEGNLQSTPGTKAEGNNSPFWWMQETDSETNPDRSKDGQLPKENAFTVGSKETQLPKENAFTVDRKDVERNEQPHKNAFTSTAKSPEQNTQNVETEITDYQKELNKQIMNIIKEEFPNSGKEIEDSNGIVGFHVGLLTTDFDEVSNLRDPFIGKADYFALLEQGGPEQKELASYIKTLFKSQNDQEGVTFSEYGMSKPDEFIPIKRTDFSNSQEYSTLTKSLLEFDDHTLKVFYSALKIIDNANREYVEGTKRIQKLREIAQQIKTDIEI